MILNELVNQAKKVKDSRSKSIRRSRTKNMAIGAGIGTAIGLLSGILFAPKPGKETRKIIAERTGEAVKNIKENAAAVKDKVSAKVASKVSEESDNEKGSKKKD